MPSIRDQLVGTWVERLATLPDWTSRRGTHEMRANVKILAESTWTLDSHTITNNEQYDATMQVATIISVRDEDADPELEPDPDDDTKGDPVRYADRMATLAQQQIHNPDTWGPNPPFQDVKSLSVEMVGRDPDASTTSVMLSLQFTYRFSITDPSTP